VIFLGNIIKYKSEMLMLTGICSRYRMTDILLLFYLS